MKPTEIQIKAIDSIISIIETWKDTNDISSPTHYTDIEEFLYADLDEIIPYRQRECLENELSKVFDRIKRLE